MRQYKLLLLQYVCLLFVFTTHRAYGTGCGGTLTRSSGQIQSPDEDNDGVFDHGVECEWTLLFENKIIELHMLRLDLKTPSFENCNTELSRDRYASNKLYATIYDESGKTFNIHWFCESLEIIKSINHLKVHFYSFDSERPVTGLGFIAAYEAIDKADPGCVDYVPSTEYNGNLSVTVNGRQCQSWSSVYPYNDTLEDDNRFPMDGSVIAAKNFCRDPTNEGNIWCYTVDPGVVWEYCSFRPLCGTRCGGALTRNSGQIQPPDVDKDGLFDYGVECAWSLVFEGKTIELQVALFDLRTARLDTCDGGDGDSYIRNRLYVYTYEENGSPENTYRFCYPNVNTPIIRSRNKMELHFFSFESGQPLTGLGFIVVYEVIDSGTTDCWNMLLTEIYNGTLSVTANGHTCQAWSEQWPHLHFYAEDSKFPVDGSVSAASNYCRDPDGEGRTWCYIMNPEIRWEYCNFPPCTDDSGCIDYIPSTQYNGNLSVTVNGRQCKFWSAMYPYNLTFEDDSRFPIDGSAIAAKNFCRDPTNKGIPWCYTNNPDVVWEYCSFRPCSYECVDTDLSTAYRGQLSMTANGRTCQHWSEQSPHSHSFTEESFEGEPSLNAVMNYCRDPFGEGRTWCYTTESDIAWEYCYFPPCHWLQELCGKILTSPSGIILSPDLDENGSYDDMVECSWIIKASDKQTINLKFVYLRLEDRSMEGTNELICRFDYVMVYRADVILGKYCSDDNPPLLTSSRELTIYFHSDDSINRLGFKANYTIIDKEDDYICGEELDTPPGELGYINNDMFEGMDMDCEWNIIASENQPTYLKIIYFQLNITEQCADSYLVVKERQDSDSMLGKFCGSEPPPKMLSPSGNFYLHLYSGGTLKGGGFLATFFRYTQERYYSCDSVILDASIDNGLIKSPDFDGDGLYENNLECSWTIKADIDKIVQLFILEFQLEKDYWCRFDNLKVFDGVEDSRFLLGSYCGDTAPTKFRSSSRFLYVQLTTDETGQAKGFNLQFSQAHYWAWRQWPDGDYAIPMSVYGCPDQELNNWQHSQNHAVHRHKYAWGVNGIDSLALKDDVINLGPIGLNSSTFQLNYCVKQSTSDGQRMKDAEWPRGLYAIFPTNYECPIVKRTKCISGSDINQRLTVSTVPWHLHDIIRFEMYVYTVDSMHSFNLYTLPDFSDDLVLCIKRTLSDTVAQNDLRSPFMVVSSLMTQGQQRLKFEQESERSGMCNMNSSMKLISENWIILGWNSHSNWLSYLALVPKNISMLYNENKENQHPSQIFWTIGQPTDIFETGTNEDKLVFAIYDLDRNVLISGIQFVPKDRFVSNEMRVESVLPVIIRSNIKWEFLDLGGWHCLQHIEVTNEHIEVHCLNEPIVQSARYLILKEANMSGSIMEQLLNGLWSISLFSIGDGTMRCGQYLGMRNGYIEDFQLLSPSEIPAYPSRSGRPGASGWCPLKEDLITPFLQFDLLRPTTVEGIQIIQVEEALAYTNRLEAHKYRLEYSNSSSAHRSHERLRNWFEFSLPLLEERQYMFPTPVTARYIRIYSFYYEGHEEHIRCHKFELIGCLNDGGKNMQCGPTDEAEWFNVTDGAIFNEYFYNKPRGQVENSMQADCETLCQEQANTCAVVEKNLDCNWYESSATYSYKVAGPKLDVEWAIRLCPAARPHHKQSQSFRMGNESWDSVTTDVNRPGIIVNHDYPFRYYSGGHWLWDIVFNSSSYVNLILFNVSFNQNQNKVLSQDVYDTFADRKDRLYIVADIFDLATIFTDTRISEKTDGILLVLERDSSHIETYLRRNTKRVRLVWRTYFQDLQPDQLGRGFRILAYPSDVSLPFCSPTTMCTWNRAGLASRSFIEESTILYEDIWQISTEPHRYIVLQFNYFHIQCDSLSFLVVELTSTIVKTFCNTNKPINDVRSIYGQLTIKTRFYRDLNRFPEGFQATYVVEQQLFPGESLLTQEDEEMVNFGEVITRDTFTVCSLYFGKCYILIPDVSKLLPGSTTSWSVVESEICRRNDSTLVSLHSKLEQDFVGYALLHKFNSTNNKHTYIGLVRKQSKSLSSWWTDGRPVTYMAWQNGHPASDAAHICTRMSLLLSDDHKWESVLCSVPAASIAVCQVQWNTDTKPRIENNRTSITDLSDVWNAPSYYICTNLEVISMLGRCDNTTDCTDGSDELNCPEIQDFCSKIQYQCGNGRCVSISVLCDHNQDCEDNSDEDCYFPPCSATQFQCEDKRCIDDNQRCDGKPDCHDSSDEDGCAASNCGHQDSFRCSYSECIPMVYKCDGIADCNNGKDEEDCPFPKSCQDWWSAGYQENGVYHIAVSNCGHQDSFRCSYSECIPMVFKCDGIVDCNNGKDEEDCPFPKSCQDWRSAGYQETGVYHIDGIDVECDFQTYQKNGTIKTTFHDIDKFWTPAAIYFSYSSDNRLKQLIQDTRCHQTYDQLCQPWIQLLYDMDDSIVKDPESIDWSSDHIHACTCLRLVVDLNSDTANVPDSILQNCDGKMYDQSLSDQFHFEVTRSTSYGYIEQLTLKNDHVFDVNQLMLKVNPIVCYTDFKAESPALACGYGFTTSIENRCLYRLDEYDHIIGCRSLEHLQNCQTFECPANYFKCQRSFCLDTQYVCDGIAQCADGEDEEECDIRTCVSQFHCSQSSICLPSLYICNSRNQCPDGDDERLCDFKCPESCSCVGLSVDCTDPNYHNQTSAINISSSTRMLDISGRPNALSYISFADDYAVNLAYLNLSDCEIYQLRSDLFDSMRNLLILDISFNRLERLETHLFLHLGRLKVFKLNANLHMLTISSEAFMGLLSISVLELRNLYVERLSRASFASLNLERLEISETIIKHVDSYAFERLYVEEIFISTAKIETISVEMFQGVEDVKMLVTNDFALCCIKPEFLADENCLPHSDAFSSCSDLMRNQILRSFIWIVGLFGLLGNTFSLLYHLIYQRDKLKLGYGMFVTNLAISDFLMGIYLVIIAIADMDYRGEYSMHAYSWKNSFLCNLAGVFASLSSEASIIFIGLITLDRVIVVKYPFGEYRIKQRGANILTAVSWFVGIIVSTVPVIFTPYFEHQFYSTSGVCLALPITKHRFPGWEFAVSVFIGFNFATTVLIMYGQWTIYHEVMKASNMNLTKNVKGRKNDVKVARNLMLVAGTDLLCWLPIVILGVLGTTGVTDIPADVYAWTAVFVLPINSALNPFLYALPAIMREKKQTVDEDRTSAEVVTLPKEQTKSFYTLWKKQRIFNEPTGGYVPISTLLSDVDFNLSQLLQVLNGVLRCLFGLHVRGVTQRKLDLKDIYVKQLHGRVVVSLNCRPELALDKKSHADSMERFAHIVTSLLKIYHKKN